jgi:hypothetical protein
MSRLRQVENNIHLWSLNNNTGISKVISPDNNNKAAVGVKKRSQHEQQQKQPVYTFIGHSDIVFDIHWRPTERSGLLMNVNLS